MKIREAYLRGKKGGLGIDPSASPSTRAEEEEGKVLGNPEAFP